MKPFYQGGIILLLLLYVLSVLQIESVHMLFHAHDQVELHTQEQEKDLCHRAIYHGEKENDCGHKTHVKKSDKCSLCAVVFSGAIIQPENLTGKNFVHATAYFVHEDVFSGAVFNHQRPSRAPPIG